MPESTSGTGTIKWFNSAKGYGFVTSHGIDLFIHITNVDPADKDLQSGDEVDFVAGDGQKGPVALNLRKVRT